MRRVRERLSVSAGAFRLAFSNPDLRRLQLALAGSSIGNWFYTVALAVYAFDQGGAAAVGLVTLVRLIPSAIASPFAAALGDRYSRVAVMFASDVIRAGTMAGAAAVVALDGEPAIVYALAAVSSITTTAFRPAERALLPSLARRPEELTAANVASSTIDSLSIFTGPALGGILLAATGIDVVFAVNGATFLWSALLVFRIRHAAAVADRERAAARPASAGESFLAETFAGFRVLAREADLRVIVLLVAAQVLVFGSLAVLVVVLALDVLETGPQGLGYLNSAVGAGGLIGSAVAFGLVGQARLAAIFGIGIFFWGLPIALAGAWPNQAFAIVLFAVLGLANTLVDVSSLTLLQRAVDDAVLSRVFGVLETLMIVARALGAVAAPLLVAGIGERGALIATGTVLPVLAVLAWPRLMRIDTRITAPTRELELLTGVPMFAPLPAQTVESLAAMLDRITVPAGKVLFRRGDPGDRFYVIADGELEVEAEDRTTTLGRGDYFGEIALLRDVPRTATVTARTDSELYALEREEFIAAVTGNPVSAEAANIVVGTRLGTLRPREASI